MAGENCAALGLNGEETFTIEGLETIEPRATLDVLSKSADGTERRFQVLCRIDTPNEVEYFRHGGILPYVLRQGLVN